MSDQSEGLTIALETLSINTMKVIKIKELISALGDLSTVEYDLQLVRFIREIEYILHDDAVGR